MRFLLNQSILLFSASEEVILNSINKFTMTITYLILAHRYPKQLYRLVDRLNAENVHFLIHIDKKVESKVFNSIVERFKYYENVHFIKRYTCHWAGFGIVQATMQGLKVLQSREINYDYVCLMSGQDYPIKTNDYIFSFFRSNEGKSFIHHLEFPQPHWENENGGYDRYENWYFINSKYRIGFPNKIFKKRRYLNKIVRSTVAKIIPKRKFPSNFFPHGGAQFWALHKSHVDYVIKTIDKNPSFFKFFKYVMVPDEILFQTIMGNYEHKNELINDTLHFLEWDRKGAVLTIDDKNNLLDTYHLFARKFDENIDDMILEWIDSTIHESKENI